MDQIRFYAGQGRRMIIPSFTSTARLVPGKSERPRGSLINALRIMNKSVLFIASFLALASCTDRQSVFKIGSQVVASAPEIERDLAPVASFEDSVLLGAIGVCFATDSIVLLSTAKTGNVFRVVNLHNHQTVDLLPNGRGPDEVVAGGLSAVRKDGGKTLLDVTALNELFLMSIDLEASVREQRTVVVDKEDLLSSEAWVSFFVNGKVLSLCMFGPDNYSFKLYERGSHTVLRTDQIFGDEPYLNDFYPQFGAVREMRPDQSKLCLMMSHFDEINILDLEGTNHLSISPLRKKKEDAAIIDEMLSSHELTEYTFYQSGCVTDDAIYGLYYGCSDQEMEEGFLPSIRVFSWDGEFKAVYHLSEPLVSIVLAEDGKTLYGLTEDEVLYRYDLTL